VNIKEERMRSFLFLGIILLLIVGLGLLGWSIKSSDKIHETYNIQPDLSKFSNVKNCPFFEDLIHSEFILDYPKFINKKESGNLSITINKSTNQSNSNLENNASSLFRLSLEVWIDIKDTIVEPGNRSFETYLSAQSQNFYFLITPLVNQPGKGTIWIYAIINTENNKPPDRIPIFAIPFIVRIKSFFGISPKIMTDFSLFLIVIAFLSLFLLIKLKKN
jgi:hypothetical protein